MGDRKKRKLNPTNNDNNNNKNQKRRLSNDNDMNKDELVIYRILCPVGLIGGVIGKSGKVINAIRDSTKAKIKVFDQLPGCTQRVITIYSSVKEKVDVTETEKTEEPLCSAQDALLRIHDTIVSCVDGSGGEKNGGKKKECRLLVPSSQASGLIGKAGGNIKGIRSRTRACVSVASKDVSDPSHACALEFDNSPVRRIDAATTAN